jgi:adenylate cyclase, class 2
LLNYAIITEEKRGNMEVEVEVKFLNVDFDRLRVKLREVGATLEQPMRLMRRVIIEPPHLAAQDAFIRVRDEGDKVTLTYKHFHDHEAFSGARELETTVADFEMVIEILTLGGLEPKSFQESRRETWMLGEVEIVLDEWPWLNPYIEIEGKSEDDVKNAATKLGFNWNDAVFGSTTVAYQAQYPKGDASKLAATARIAFDEPLSAIITGEAE